MSLRTRRSRCAAEKALASRRLNVRGQQQELYSLGWAQCVEAIEFTGEFPRAELRYIDVTLPVNVGSEFFSPFIPLMIRAPAARRDFTRFSLSPIPASSRSPAP